MDDFRDIPDFFQCPISKVYHEFVFLSRCSQSVMHDPVVCVDGFTYERENIEHWFREHEAGTNTDPTYTSPVTGLKLQSLLLIPNLNLAKAIAHFTHREIMLSHPVPVVETEQETPFESLQFSQWTLGKSVTLENHRSVVAKGAQPADTEDWYDSIAFSAFPSRFTADEKPRVLFLVEEAKTGWGGLTLGFSPIAADQIKTAALHDFIDASAWWLDGSSWFHTPNGCSVLVPWSSSELRVGDQVGLIVPSQGRLCVFVNGKKKLDLKDTELPVKLGTQLYGFVALTGGYKRVRIIQDTPLDWKDL